MKRLFIVGNDAFIVHAMRLALRYSSGVNLFGVIDGQGSVREAVREAMPDVVVVDGLADPQAGVQHVREVHEEAPTALVLLLSASLDDSALHDVLEAGAMACLSSSLRVPDVSADAPATGPIAVVGSQPPVATVGAAGQAHVEDDQAADASPLTARELEILQAVAEGHTNARIGRQLWVTEQTVKFHLSNIYRKLGVSNRTEASRYALIHGLVALPSRAAPEAAQDAAEVVRVPRLVSPAG